MPSTGDPSQIPCGLLRQVAAGDVGAMESCITAFGSLVWSIVLRRVNDRATAEDLTQEIFTDVWRHSGRHDPALSSEAGFIAMIARRRVIDWLRRQSRQPDTTPLTPGDDFPALPPTDTASSRLDRETVWRALERLPEETRQLFQLHFDQGLSHGEIATRTGLPLGSVKTRLRRGLIEARALVARLNGSAELSPGSMQ